MTRVGLRNVPSFTPHVTRLYGDHLAPDAQVTPVRWTARKFVLIKSLIGRTVYEDMGARPLG